MDLSAPGEPTNIIPAIGAGRPCDERDGSAPMRQFLSLSRSHLLASSGVASAPSGLDPISEDGHRSREVCQRSATVRIATSRNIMLCADFHRTPECGGTRQGKCRRHRETSGKWLAVGLVGGPFPHAVGLGDATTGRCRQLVHAVDLMRAVVRVNHHHEGVRRHADDGEG